jgi:glutathione S-transferase
MLSSFLALRTAMPTNLRGRATRPPGGGEVERDGKRVLDIWQASLESSGGPYLLGAFSIADCLYHPVAARFRTYGLDLPEFALGYSARLFARPHHLELEAIAQGTPPIAEYDAALTAAG